MLRQLPADAALWRALNPEGAAWTLDRQLLASTVDVLAVANWQRAGGKRKDKPSPLPRPGIKSGTRTGNASRFTPVAARRLLDSFKPQKRR